MKKTFSTGVCLIYNAPLIFNESPMNNQSNLVIALAQMNPVVGDVVGNAEKILYWSTLALQDYQADVVIFPELTITGYPPEDLLFRAQFLQQIESAIEMLELNNPGLTMIFGAVTASDQRLYNSAVILQKGQAPQVYFKHFLPNYGVFDEQRYLRRDKRLEWSRLRVCVWASQCARISGTPNLVSFL